MKSVAIFMSQKPVFYSSENPQCNKIQFTVIWNWETLLNPLTF